VLCIILCDVCYCIVLHYIVLSVLHCSTLPPGINPFAVNNNNNNNNNNNRNSTRHTVQHSTLTLYNNVLHFSVYQKHHRAALLQKFKKNLSTAGIRKFFFIEISLIFSLTKNLYDANLLTFFLKPKHVARYCVALEYLVWR
jgi:hypothetical protein